MSKLHLPSNLESQLNKEGIHLNKDGELIKITVMFVNIKGFSQVLEKHDTKRVLKILDIFFRIIASIVEKNDGIVDKLDRKSVV